MRKSALIFAVFLSMGVAASSLAMFASAMELDQGSGWGKARIIILLLGVFFLLCAAVCYFFTDKVFGAAHRFGQYVRKNSVTAYLINYASAFLAIAVVFLVYIWLVTSGTWTSWVSAERYYANLARGFQKGEIYLLSNPSPLLRSLPDPYDLDAREKAGVQAPVDLSYYNGRYYLYWGPVPSLLLLGVSLFYGGRIGDLQIAFAFACGLFLLLSLIVVVIWERFFYNLPKWLLFISILTIGLRSPIVFMLNSFSGARIYEAAISGGQFFLFGGFVLVLKLSNQPVPVWKLAFASILWALAIGTRLFLALPVAVFVLVLVYEIFKARQNTILRLIALGLPLALGFLCLGWYNWARFGSVTETGLYYQLAGWDIHQHFGELFSPLYVFQNLYNYLFNPFGIDSRFPFLYSTLANSHAVLPFYSLPAIYQSQPVTGLFYAVPFWLLAIIPLALLFENVFKKYARDVFGDDWHLLRLPTLMLLGSSLVAFGFLLNFFWVAMRYVDDFLPSLIILSAIGFWQGYSLLLRAPLGRKVYTIFTLILASASMIVGMLLATSANFVNR